MCDSARCQRKTVWPQWKYFCAEIFPRTELREKLSGGKSPALSLWVCVYFRQARDSIGDEALGDSAGSPQSTIAFVNCNRETNKCFKHTLKEGIIISSSITLRISTDPLYGQFIPILSWTDKHFSESC